MAEALGVASSITALLTIAAQLSKLSYNLYSDLRNAPRTQKVFLQEVSALTDVLLRAELTCKDAEAMGVAVQRPESLSQLRIDECTSELESLRTILKDGISRAKWLFRERDIVKHLEALEIMKRCLVDFMSLNTLATATKTSRSVDELHQDNQRRILLDWLDRNEETSGPLPSSTQGTGSWFTSSDLYGAWKNGKHAMLWCYGPPGSGKSSLASVAIHDLMQQPRSSCIMYYFCEFALRKRQDLRAILESLVRQMTRAAENRVIQTLLKHKEAIKQAPTVSSYEDMLAAGCKELLEPYLVFDAPDELDDPASVLKSIKKLAQNGCKILVTSRDIPAVKQALCDEPFIEILARETDLKIYVESRLRDVLGMARQGSMDTLVSAVIQKANGIFLLARILVDSLLELTTVRHMKKAVASFPCDVGGAFESTLERINAQSDARRQLALRVIGWLTCAYKRLTGEALGHAFSLEDGDDDVDDDNIPNIELMLQVCHGVVHEANDGTISMIHTTAYQYFSGRVSKSTHEDVASTCLRYMSLGHFRQGPCETVEEYEKRERRFGFYSYGCQHFGDHVLAGDLESKLERPIRRLLETRNSRLSLLQASQYKISLGDRTLAKDYLDAIPTEQTPLHVAALWNLSRIAGALLVNGADPNAKDSHEWTPLHWAAFQKGSHTLTKLLAHGADVNMRDVVGWTPLFWAALNGSLEDIKTLLRYDADVVAPDVHGWSPLTWAVQCSTSDRLKAVELLLNHRQAQFTANRVEDITYEVSEMELSATKWDTEVFDILMEHVSTLEIGIDKIWASGRFDPPVSNIWRATHKAERYPRLERVCKPRGQIDKRSGKSKLLHRAIQDEKFSVARILLELGADPNGTFRGERWGALTLLHVAAFRQDPRFAEALLQSGAEHATRDEEGKTALHQAVLNGFVDTATALVRGGSDVNAAVEWLQCPIALDDSGSRNFGGGCPEYGMTPLMIAYGLRPRWNDRVLRSRESASQTQMQTRKLTQLLLDSGADVTLRDSLDRTALHHATQTGDVELVRILADLGADINAADVHGQTPLYCAQHHFELVEYLLSQGASPMARDREGRTLIHHLAYCDFQEAPSAKVGEMLDQLLDIGGQTSFNQPVENNFVNLCRQLSPSFSPDQMRHASFRPTPILLALWVQNWILFRRLDERGAVFPVDSDMLAWMDFSTLSMDPEVMCIVHRHLVAAADRPPNRYVGESVERPFRKIFDSFRYNVDDAKVDNFIRVTEVLIQVGFDINQQNPEKNHHGKTILSMAVDRRYPARLVSMLLELGADAEVKDDFGFSPLVNAALRHKYEELGLMLQNLGFDLDQQETSAISRKELNIFCSYLSSRQRIDHLYVGKTLLIQAVEESHVELVRVLLQFNADAYRGFRSKSFRAWVYQKEVENWSALHEAARGGKIDVLPTLIEFMPSLDATDSQGWTALHVAAYFGRNEAMKLLLDAGGNYNVATAEWERDPDASLTPCELSAGAPTVWRLSPLDLASMEARLATVEMLLAAGASTVARPLAPTALHLALESKKSRFEGDYRIEDEALRVAELLVQHGADVVGAANHLSDEQIETIEKRNPILGETLRGGLSMDKDKMDKDNMDKDKMDKDKMDKDKMDKDKMAVRI